MRKILLILFLLSFHFAYAGTGSANDEIHFILVIIAILLFILAILYSIDFIRRLIKEHKEKKIARLTDKADSENISPSDRDLFTETPSEPS
jgi:hypothetical protein